MAGTISIDTTSQTFSGSRQPDPDLCLIHTTEVWGWPPYAGGKEAPHVTVKPIRGVGIQVRVHRPPTDYGKSLANREGGVETNRRGVWQIELMGTCDPSRKGEMYFWPEADDAVLSALAEFVRPTLVRFDIPPVAVAPFLPYPKSYGSKGGQRLSFTAWNKARGICGHQHAPENDHGDPGAFPVARFIEFLKEDDMPLTDADAKKIWAYPYKGRQALGYLVTADANARQARADAAAALAIAKEQAQVGRPLSADEVKAIVDKALDEKIEDATGTVIINAQGGAQ